MLDTAALRFTETVVAAATGRGLGRRQNQIVLIASENIISLDVLVAQGARSGPTSMPRATPACATTAAASSWTRWRPFAIGREAVLRRRYANVRLHDPTA